MMRRFVIMFFAIFLLALPFAARADVVLDNEFLVQHYDEAQRLDRYLFCANGPNGYVFVKEKPGSKKVIGTYQNGEKIFLGYTYIYKDTYWGADQPTHHRPQWPGWIPMDQLLAMYTPEDFEKEHQDEFYEYTGNFAAVFSAEKIVFWQWPGSDREKRVFPRDNKAVGFVVTSVSVHYAYKDQEGREWGYASVAYDQAFRNTLGQTVWEKGQNGYGGEWICLNYPENSDIPAFNPAPGPAKWSPDDAIDWTDTSIIYYDSKPVHINFWLLEDMTLVVIAMSITVLAAGTIAFIYVFRKRNKTKNGGQD